MWLWPPGIVRTGLNQEASAPVLYAIGPREVGVSGQMRFLRRPWTASPL